MERTNKTRLWIESTMLVALTVVLQLTAGLVKVGTITFTFVLIPLVIGAVLHGVRGGFIVGTAFGATVFVQSLTGMEPFGAFLLNINWFYTFLAIVGRCVVLGILVALVNKALSKTGLHSYLTSLISSIAAPVINTGIFLLLFSTLFNDVLMGMVPEDGAGVINYIIFGLVGLNFLIEFGTTVILCPPIIMALKTLKSRF